MRDLLQRAGERYRVEGVGGLFEKSLSFGRRAGRVDILYPNLLLEHSIGVVSRSDLRNNWKSWSFSEEAEIYIEKPTENPITGQSPPSRLSENARKYKRDKPFVAELTNVDLIGRKAIPIVEDGIVLESFSSRRDRLENDLLENKGELARLRRYTSQSNADTQYDCVCSFASVGSGYCGWVQSTLTRLQGLEYYEQVTGNQPKILLPQNPAEWMIDSLKFFGYSEDDLIIWDGGVATAERFVVPSVRTGEYTDSYYRAKLSHDDPLRVVHPGACEWLRKESYQKLDIEPQSTEKFLYISRAEASRRSVRNRDDLERVLENYGFEIRIMESLPFSKQIEEIAKADLILSPHGAGLVNTIFASDATVIELFGSNVKSTYFLLSSLLGHEYQFVKSDQAGNDITINPNTLSEILESSG